MKNAKEMIFCIRCEGYTNHKIIFEDSKKYTPDNYPAMMIDFAEVTWELLMCCGCDAVTFRETWISSEDFDMNSGQSIPEVKLYPPRGENLLPINTYYQVPENLRRIYREVIDCYNNGLYTLCAAGLRILVEGICDDKNVKKGPVEVGVKGGGKKTFYKKSIEGKINGMVERGYLTREHADSLHENRFIGNSAIHKLRTPITDNLKIAIAIVVHTLDNLYELPQKASMLRIKRKML